MLTSRVFQRTVLLFAAAWLLAGVLQAAEAEKSIKVEKAKVPPPPVAAPAPAAAPAAAPAPAAPAPAAPAPAAPAPAPAATPAPAPAEAPAAVVEDACCAPAAKCCCPKDRCIHYRDHKLLGHKCHRNCCQHEPPTHLVLQVKDPCCCGCVVEVPVCAPACLQGEPKVESCCGLLGRGVVTYVWCTGFKVKIVFQHDGDLVVHTFGT